MNFAFNVESLLLQDMKKREDLRNLTVCSVDPPGCTDIDDALHCRELDSGNLEARTRTHTIKPYIYFFFAFILNLAVFLL